MDEKALKGFELLSESVPGWIADIENMVNTATERQKEILFENQPAEQPVLAAVPEPSAPEPSAPSVHRSVRSREEDRAQSKPGTPVATLLRPQLPHMTQSDALRLAQRKRKTASVCSDQSGPAKYRSRSMIVIYYDGEMQKRFETLVRAVGSCRNSLRKSKMSAQVDAFSRTAAPGSSDGSSGGEDTITKLDLKYSCTRRRSSGAAGKDDGLEGFNKVDGLLEKAQTLCERAAHQLLRDGDCALELNNAKEFFVSAHKLGEEELLARRKKAEALAAERRRQQDERHTTTEEEEQDEKNWREKSTPTDEVPLPSTTFSAPDIIEVDLEPDDDSDNDDGDQFDPRSFAVNSVSLGKYQMRSSRLVVQH